MIRRYAEKILQMRVCERCMNEGVSIIDPQTTFIDPSVKIGKNTIIYPFTFIEKGVIIGNNCSLGPFLHLRERVYVKENSCVGNFAEVCRSRIGKNVRMKHFCYVGDAQVGEGVNIGAGAVVANFDGRKKSKTSIGNGAFIGSHTVLVAPVKVGQKAVTGAGSIVTRNVKGQTVVVGVPAKPLRKKKKCAVASASPLWEMSCLMIMTSPPYPPLNELSRGSYCALNEEEYLQKAAYWKILKSAATWRRKVKQKKRWSMCFPSFLHWQR